MGKLGTLINLNHANGVEIKSGVYLCNVFNFTLSLNSFWSEITLKGIFYSNTYLLIGAKRIVGKFVTIEGLLKDFIRHY